MSRIIKFRAWSNGLKYMYYHEDNIDEPNLWNLKPYVVSGTLVSISSDILMQYIGLKDCNDQEIYEGDIVKYTVDLGGGSKKTYIGQIIWNDEWACWDIVTGPIHEFDWVKIARNGYEVIGNIYTNPELLEVK